MDLIRMKNVKKTYHNGVTALYDMSLTIKKGEFVFVIGHTGCGKSTLVKMLYRQEKPDSGYINVGGIDVTKLKNSKVYKLRRKIGVVFQDFKLLISSNTFIISKLVLSSKLPVGSSHINSFGPLTIARAIATRCCSPPDNSVG